MNYPGIIARLAGSIGLLGLLGGTAHAVDFDGSQNLICSSKDVLECTYGEGCSDVPAREINSAEFWRIDFDKKEIRGVILGRPSSRVSKIKRQDVVDGKLILQGVEDGHEEDRDGLGWTVAITQHSARMTITASADEAAFIIFGSCTAD